MKVLLDRRGDDVKITDEMVGAAAGNSWAAKEVMKLLLDRRETTRQLNHLESAKHIY